jgi:NAD(P)-dependent dehydrogenase (short-subunit alcohol dehydrogenase family)
MTTKRVLFITGGAGGIGLESCKRFGNAGYAVAVNDYSRENGEKALAQLQALGIEAALFVGDVTKEASVNALVADVVAKFGRIDVLFNNAGGLGGRASAEEMTLDFWNRVVDLNLTSCFFVTRACIPHLKKSGKAAVINVTSIAAYNGGGPGASAYAVAKAGVLALTRAHAKELIPFGIRVNAVSPGTIDTPFHDETRKNNPALMDKWIQDIPAKRLGQPYEVADLVFFLASDQSAYLVGEVIQINGGQMML